MAELKKCPFCGGEAEIEREWVDGFYQKYYSCVHVVCQKCYATIGQTYGDKDRSKAYAIKAWNKRPTEAEIRAKAIDEFAEKCIEKISKYHDPLNILDIRAIAEQLKGE